VCERERGRAEELLEGLAFVVGEGAEARELTDMSTHAVTPRPISK
jgi:hypothetical protein